MGSPEVRPRSISWESNVNAVLETLSPEHITPLSNDRICVRLPSVVASGRTWGMERELGLPPDSPIPLIRECMRESLNEAYRSFGSTSPRVYTVPKLVLGKCKKSSPPEESSSCSSASGSSSPAPLKKQRSLARGAISSLQERIRGVNPFRQTKDKHEYDGCSSSGAYAQGFVWSDAIDYKWADGAQAMAQSWMDFDERALKLTSQIPDIPLSRARSGSSSICVPEKLDLNNNGLPCDFKKVTPVLDGDNFATHAVNRGETQKTLIEITAFNDLPINSEHANKAYYSIEEKCIYPSPEDAIYHDAVCAQGGNGKPAIITLCDGCHKGPLIALTAVTAAESGQRFLKKKLKKCTTTRDVMRRMFECIKHTQFEIAKLEAGRDTTFLQVVVIGNKLLGTSIGDGKVYVFRPQQGTPDGMQTWTCTDLTRLARESTDMASSGGFLKSCAPETFPPDTIGMKAFYMELQEGDVVFACSDGTSDNFDPSLQKQTPSDLGIVSVDGSWSKIDTKNPANIAKIEEFALSRLTEVVHGATTGKEIRDRIAHFITENTEKRLLTYLTNLSTESLANLPGKMDDAAMAYFEYRTQ